MGIVQTNIEKMDDQFKRWGARIDKLAASAETAEEHLREDYHKHVENLRTQHKDALARFETVKEAGEETWDAFCKGVKSAWNDAESTFAELKHDVKEAIPALDDADTTKTEVKPHTAKHAHKPKSPTA